MVAGKIVDKLLLGHPLWERQFGAVSNDKDMRLDIDRVSKRLFTVATVTALLLC